MNPGLKLGLMPPGPLQASWLVAVMPLDHFPRRWEQLYVSCGKHTRVDCMDCVSAVDSGVGDPVWLQNRDKLTINFNQPCQGTHGTSLALSLCLKTFSPERLAVGFNHFSLPKAPNPSTVHQLISRTAKVNHCTNCV